jgi:hypothetical protein
MTTRRKKIVVLIETEYDDEKFEPSVEPARGKAGLCDYASYVESMHDDILAKQKRNGHEPGYRFSDVTVYTLDDFVRDLQEGKIANEEEPPQQDG